MTKALVLTSGGLDSTTCLAIARDAGHEIYALSFDYGQRHRNELECAKLQAKAFDAKKHVIAAFDLREFGGSALTDQIDVPKDALADQGEQEIPITYVPARNTIFLSFALGWAEVLKADAIYIGISSVDYSGYPDCRPEFIAAFSELARLATKEGVSGTWNLAIETPLTSLSKAETIQLGTRLGVDYANTWSCYDPSAQLRPCGHCDSCLLRARGFAEAGLPDPSLA